VVELVIKGKKRGLMHPYLKNFIIERSNPLSRARKNLRLQVSAIKASSNGSRNFDLDKIHFGKSTAAAQIAAPPQSPIELGAAGACAS